MKGKKSTEAKPAEGKLHVFSGCNLPSPDFFSEQKSAICLSYVISHFRL